MGERSSDEQAADRRKAVSIAGRIRAYWKGLGLDLRVEVLPDGSIRSDMIRGQPCAGSSGCSGSSVPIVAGCYSRRCPVLLTVEIG